MDQSVGGSIEQLVYNGKVLWIRQVAPLVLFGIGVTKALWALCIVFYPVGVADVEGQFDAS